MDGAGRPGGEWGYLDGRASHGRGAGCGETAYGPVALGSVGSAVTLPSTGDMRRLVEKLITGVSAAKDVAEPAAILAGLDSVSLVELVVALEARFGLALTADVITAEAFSSVDGIVAALAGCAAHGSRIAGP